MSERAKLFRTFFSLFLVWFLQIQFSWDGGIFFNGISEGLAFHHISNGREESRSLYRTFTMSGREGARTSAGSSPVPSPLDNGSSSQPDSQSAADSRESRRASLMIRSQDVQGTRPQQLSGEPRQYPS